MDSFHKSVLLKETVDYLKVRPGKKYIDATLGGGGHSFEILKRGGVVLGIDCDQEAIEYVQEEIKDQKSNIKDIEEKLTLVRGNFRDLKEIALLNNFYRVSGIVFDLGVSSHQIDTQSRGFSFMKPAILDMRMDQSLKLKALDLVNILTKGELYELFSKLGEEPRARAISDSIFRARGIKPVQTTEELSFVVEQSYGLRGGARDPKTKARINSKVFQALRIAVNDELNNLKEGLPQAVELLETDGKLAVISFHSLEDRIVKEIFKNFEDQGLGKILTKKVIKPGFLEINSNPRSRSAKMRIFEKI